MLENGGLPDPAVAADDFLLMLAQRYTYVFPSDSALAMLAGLGPLVEMGAGTGYWARRLRAIGVDIVAFDQAPPGAGRPNRYHPGTRPWGRVEQGDQTVPRCLSGHSIHTRGSVPSSRSGNDGRLRFRRVPSCRC